MKLLIRRAPGTILRDQTLPSSAGGTHPHLFDVYVPNGEVDFVMVALHGGSGNKQFLPQAMGITHAAVPTVRQVNWTALETFRTILIVPQGQHCNGVTGPFNPNGVDTVSSKYPDGVATWSNFFMWSGADDVAMLKDMSTWIKTHYSGVARVLSGHSNGGMMVSRMWLEWPETFNLYASTSGPLPLYYDTAGLATPTKLQPFYVRYSLLDTVLGISGGRAGAANHFWDDTWLQQPEQFSVANYAYPELGGWLGGPRFFAWQATQMGATFSQTDATVTPVGSSTRTRWALLNNDLVMDLISGGGHGLVDQAKATRELPFAVWMRWAFGTFSS